MDFSKQPDSNKRRKSVIKPKAGRTVGSSKRGGSYVHNNKRGGRRPGSGGIDSEH